MAIRCGRTMAGRTSFPLVKPFQWAISDSDVPPEQIAGLSTLRGFQKTMIYRTGMPIGYTPTTAGRRMRQFISRNTCSSGHAQPDLCKWAHTHSHDTLTESNCEIASVQQKNVIISRPLNRLADLLTIINIRPA